MNSKLMWGLIVTLACASAVRRGGKNEELSVAAGLEHIQSLLEKHTDKKKAKKSAEMLRSLQEMAAVATPGVVGNMSVAMESLQQNVIDKVLRDSAATQTKITDSVTHIDNTAQEASAKKGAADTADQAWDSCVVNEMAVMEEIVQLQETYNQRTSATVPPCQKEIDTESFTHTSAALTVDCNLVTDPGCEAAFKGFQDSVAAMVKKMEEEVNASVALHTRAETSCEAANNSQILSKAALGSEQVVWELNHSTCLGKGVSRNGAICTYGYKLQAACGAKSTYDTLISDVTGADNPMSISDRKDELEVGELVICLLNNFVTGTDLSETIITGCSQNATNKLSQLDLDLKDSHVSQTVQANDIVCDNGSIIPFSGFEWSVPMPPDDELPRPAQFNQILPLPIPTYENTSLPEYVKQPWKATYSSTDDPFTVCA